jgi:hypothetical protein
VRRTVSGVKEAWQGDREDVQHAVEVQGVRRRPHLLCSEIRTTTSARGKDRPPRIGSESQMKIVKQKTENLKNSERNQEWTETGRRREEGGAGILPAALMIQTSSSGFCVTGSRPPTSTSCAPGHAAQRRRKSDFACYKALKSEADR